MSTQEAPPPAPPPIETPVDLWEPVGDPAQLREAARAWEEMAGRLEATREYLEARVSGTQAWSGGSREGFEAYWGQNAAALSSGADGFSDVARQLREMADRIEEANDVIQMLYVELAATAGVMVLTGVVSFGAGAVAGAARAAVLVARVKHVHATLSALLNAHRAVITTIRASKIARFSARFAGWAAEGVVVQGAVQRVALDENPLELDSWSGADAAGVASGGLLGAAGATLARGAAGPAIARRVEALHGHHLQRIERSVPGAHFFSRHGAHTTLEQHRTRLLDGVTPDGVKGPRVPSSRFFSNRDQLEAMERAQTIHRQTGKPAVRLDMGRDIGEGYVRPDGGLVRTSQVVVRFRDGRPYTAYPDIKRAR